MTGFILGYPKIRALVLLPAAVILAFLLIQAWYWGLYPAGDFTAMTLEEAIERSRGKTWAWVELTDADQLQWHCDTMVYWTSDNNKWMDIVLTNPSQSVVLVVDFADQIHCDEIIAQSPAFKGKFSHMDRDSYDYHNFEGRLDGFPSDATYVKLDTDWGPDNTLFIVVFGFGLIVLFLVGGLHGFYKGFIQSTITRL